MSILVNKFFVYPFGADGDKSAIPDTTQIDGSVSYEEGFGFNYQRDLVSDPDALPVPRPGTNQLYYDITTALKQYQIWGIPNFVTTAQNLATPLPYSKYAMALYDDGVNGVRVFQSKVDTNTALPTVTANWLWLDNNANKIIYDDVVFEGTVVNGNAVYWDATNTRYAKALADGSLAQNVIGIADVTFKRVYGGGLCGLLTGLTPGAVYYLSGITPGVITSTPPASNIVQIGVAQSATALFLERSSSSFSSGSRYIYFTSNASWTVPSGVTSITVSCVGGGGGGGGSGGCGGGGSPQATGGGGGGGAGSVVLAQPIVVTPGESLTVVVGTNGAGGSAGGAGGGAGNGGNGGTTSIARGGTVLAEAGGGDGGGGSVAWFGDQIAYGGNAGNHAGGPGQIGFSLTATGATGTISGAGGSGGSGPFGSGGVGGKQVGIGTGGVAQPGTQGQGFGVGGGGAGGCATGTTGIGGADGAPGTIGLLKIEY